MPDEIRDYFETISIDKVNCCLQRETTPHYLSSRTQPKLSTFLVAIIPHASWPYFTEPGIYFIPALIDAWSNEKKLASFINYSAVEKYRKFGGVRIEDDVLITPTGHRVLGPAIPKTVQDIQAAMKR